MKILENENIISYSDDGTLRIWDKNSYECIDILKGHENPIIGIEILENKNFISYSNDIVNIFCKDSYKCIKSIQVDNDFEDLNIKILDNNNFILYWKETPYSRRMLYPRDFQIRVFDKDSYECLMIIGQNNIDEYYSSLAVIDSIMDCTDYIFSNYFEENYLYIKNKKIESELKWFSNYIPKINTTLGDKICVKDDQSMRMLKVINHEK